MGIITLDILHIGVLPQSWPLVRCRLLHLLWIVSLWYLSCHKLHNIWTYGLGAYPFRKHFCLFGFFMWNLVPFAIILALIQLISRGYWWPQPWKLVEEFIKSCDACARSNASHHRPYGLLQPLPIPKRPWASLSMDFIIELPFIGVYDSVFVMVDRFTKMAHFAPCAKTITGEEKTYFFFKMLLDYMVSK